jgi:hypothetical protein
MITSSPAAPDLKTVGVLRLFGGREMYSVDIYNRVRRACLKDGMSA